MSVPASNPATPAHSIDPAASYDVLVQQQIAANRTRTVLIALAAVANAAFVALIAGAIGGLAAGLITVALIAALMAGAWYFADRLVPRTLGASLMIEEQYPNVRPIVERLATRMSVPVPKVYVIPQHTACNAFAFGVGEGAMLMYTTGLLTILPERELEAVTAHELAHLANRDTRVGGVSLALLGWAVFVCNVVTIIAVMIAVAGAAVGWPERRENAADIFFRLTFAFAFVVFAAMLYVFFQIWFALAKGAHLAVVRQREWMADATAAKVTGDPEALVRALLMVEQNNPTLEHGRRTFQSMCIIGEPSKGHWWSNLTEDHPSTERRVARLHELLGTTARPPEPAPAGAHRASAAGPASASRPATPQPGPLARPTAAAASPPPVTQAPDDPPAALPHPQPTQLPAVAAIVVAIAAAVVAVVALTANHGTSAPSPIETAIPPGSDSAATSPGISSARTTTPTTSSGATPGSGPPGVHHASAGPAGVINRHLVALGNGEYAVAFALMSPAYRRQTSGWVSSRTAAQPRLAHVTVLGSSVHGAVADVKLRFYARDTHRVAGSDLRCRRFEGTAHAVRVSGRWRYAPCRQPSDRDRAAWHRPDVPWLIRTGGVPRPNSAWSR